jgi:hypothetical protein
MKSKGPVDFFLGVFLEFGAAFCLLFFLPQVPWHWLPGESGREPTAVNSPQPLSGVAATERRVSLLPVEPSFTRPEFALSLPTRREAPDLLPAEVEPAVSFSSPRAVPPASHAKQDSAERATSFYHREVPRRYQY